MIGRGSGFVEYKGGRGINLGGGVAEPSMSALVHYRPGFLLLQDRVTEMGVLSLMYIDSVNKFGAPGSLG